jgi:hypothetical protein
MTMDGARGVSIYCHGYGSGSCSTECDVAANQCALNSTSDKNIPVLHRDAAMDVFSQTIAGTLPVETAETKARLLTKRGLQWAYTKDFGLGGRR